MWEGGREIFIMVKTCVYYYLDEEQTLHILEIHIDIVSDK